MRAIMLLSIRLYQLCLSPLFPGCCRFQPTCSAYASQAIAEHGLLKGAWFALRRLVRCHPLCPGGFDPVPPGPGRE